jgi:hypothetical protein
MKSCCKTTPEAFPGRQYVRAGEHMRPERTFHWDEESGCWRVKKMTDSGSGNVFVPYRFVSPGGGGPDLGTWAIPVEWTSNSEFDGTCTLPRILFGGYQGVDIRKILISGIDTINRHFQDLKTEWACPRNSISNVRYSFKKTNGGYQNNMGLLIGQLLRFGGMQLLVALRIAGCGEYLKAAGI